MQKTSAGGGVYSQVKPSSTPTPPPLVSASLPSPPPQVPLTPCMECSALAMPPPGRGCLTAISLMLTWLNMAQNRLANVCCKLNKKTGHREFSVDYMKDGPVRHDG